jgi:hypothetical protein
MNEYPCNNILRQTIVTDLARAVHRAAEASLALSKSAMPLITDQLEVIVCCQIATVA